MSGGLDFSLAVAAGLVLPLEDAASAATGVAALCSRAQTSPVRDAEYVPVAFSEPRTLLTISANRLKFTHRNSAGRLLLRVEMFARSDELPRKIET
jgi:hypothetical protein